MAADGVRRSPDSVRRSPRTSSSAAKPKKKIPSPRTSSSAAAKPKKKIPSNGARRSRSATPSNAVGRSGSGTMTNVIMSSLTSSLLGKANHDNAQFEAAIKRCIPSEFVLIASQDDGDEAQEDYFAMDHYGLKAHVPKYVRKANAGACATSALLSLMYENPERLVAGGREDPMDVLELSQELKKRVKECSKLEASPTISSSRPLGPPRMDKTEYAPFYVVPPGYKGTRRALLIGVVTGEGPDLKGPPNDVINIQQFLQKHCGFQQKNIMVLQDFYDGAGILKPTKRNILEGFQKMVRQSQPGDICFIQFSGHGGRIGNQLYICPSDYKKAGNVSDEMILKDLIKAMPANVYTTMLVDCCYSGTVGDLPYVLNSRNTTQQIDAYYDLDMRKEMLRKEAQDPASYQKYKQARAEKRLMGRIADVVSAVTDAATAAGKTAANAAVYTGKTAATAVSVTGTTAMNTAVYTGKTAATAVSVTGKTATKLVTGTGKAATAGANFVGKTGISAVSTMADGIRHSAGAANLAAAAAASTAASVRNSTGGMGVPRVKSSELLFAKVRNSTGGMGVPRVKSSELLFANVGKSNFGSAIKRAATVSLSGGAAKQATKDDEKARKKAVERSKREAMEARQQASGTATNNDNKTKHVNNDDASELSTPGRVSRSSRSKLVSNSFSVLSNAAKKGVKTTGAALRRCETCPTPSSKKHLSPARWTKTTEAAAPVQVDTPSGPAQRRGTVLNVALAMEAEQAARNEAIERSRQEAREAREEAKRGSSRRRNPPRASAQRRSTAINFAMALEAEEDARKEALERSRREAAEAREAARKSRATSPARPRKSVMNLAMAFETKAVGEEMSISKGLTRKIECPVRPRKSVMNMALELEAMTFNDTEAFHELEVQFSLDGAESQGVSSSKTDDTGPSKLNPAEGRKAARKTRPAPAEPTAKNESTQNRAQARKSPCRPRMSVMNLAMAFDTNKLEDEAPNDSGKAKERPVLPRQSVTMMALDLEALAFDEAKGQISLNTKDTKNRPIQPIKSVVNCSLPMKVVEVKEEEEEEHEICFFPEESVNQSTDNGLINERPAQRRSTAINLAMAVEEEEAARREAMERSRREAAEAREAARKARMAREGGKGLANDRPAQRRSTAINKVMAIEAEELARNEALERSRKDAAEAREAARKAKTGSTHRPAQRRSTALNFAMAMEAEEAARKEALERSRREAAEARAVARSARLQRAVAA